MFVVLLGQAYGRRVYEIHDQCVASDQEIEDVKEQIHRDFTKEHPVECEVVYIGESYATALTRILFNSYTIVADFNRILLSVEPTAAVIQSVDYSSDDLHEVTHIDPGSFQVLSAVYNSRLDVIEKLQMDLPPDKLTITSGIIALHTKWIDSVFKILVDLHIRNQPLIIPEEQIGEFTDILQSDVVRLLGEIDEWYLTTVKEYNDKLSELSDQQEEDQRESEEFVEDEEDVLGDATNT